MLKRVNGLVAHWKEKPLWVHVASSGELEQCLPILDEIKQHDPNQKIFLTYFSPTAKKAIELERIRRQSSGRNLPWDGSDYAPWDFAFFIRKFLDILKPSKLVTVHREVWPNLLSTCKKRSIPTWLIAASFPLRSQGFRFWCIQKSLSSLDFVGTTDASSFLFLKGQLPETTVKHLGDPRIDRVLQRKENHFAADWRAFFPENRASLVLASVWIEDVQALQADLTQLISDFPDLRLVIVPHEPNPAWCEELEKMFGARLWSRFLESPDFSSPLIVNTVGLLAELYQVAFATFVGGSFKGKVHNVLEPAVYGNPIVTGPRITNSTEALALEKLGALISVQNGKRFGQEVSKLLRSPAEKKRRSEICFSFIEQNRGASKRYARSLLETS